MVPFDLRRLYLHNRRLIGSSMHIREHFAELARTARTGRIGPHIAERRPLTEIHQAQRRFVRDRHAGKIIIRP